MTRYHQVNDERIPFTAEEETAFDAKEKAWLDGANDRAMKVLRERRNQLLAETDGVFSSDTPSELGTQELKDYRQKLRDLPATTDVLNPVWPTKPE